MYLFFSISGLSISIELPRCNISLGKELYFVKLPNFLSVDTKPFDPNYYEDISSDEDEILDEEGRARLKLKVNVYVSIKRRLDSSLPGPIVKTLALTQLQSSNFTV